MFIVPSGRSTHRRKLSRPLPVRFFRFGRTDTPSDDVRTQASERGGGSTRSLPSRTPFVLGKADSSVSRPGPRAIAEPGFSFTHKGLDKKYRRVYNTVSFKVRRIGPIGPERIWHVRPLVHPNSQRGAGTPAPPPSSFAPAPRGSALGVLPGASPLCPRTGAVIRQRPRRSSATGRLHRRPFFFILPAKLDKKAKEVYNVGSFKSSLSWATRPRRSENVQ